MSAAKFFPFLVLVFGSLGLVACGGSDNKSSAAPAPGIAPWPPVSPAVPSTPPVLPPAPSSPFPAPTSASPYYLAAAGGGPVGGQVIGLYGGPPIRVGHLVVVDPASPTTPVALEAATHWHALAEFKEGVIDTSANSVSNPHTRFLVYLKGNRVYRLDLRRGTWPPAPAPVSSLTATAAAGCGGAAIHDVRNAERSWIVLTGCATSPSRQWAVRADMSAADSPVAVASEVVGAMRASDGAITGFVVRDGNQVRKVDTAFANAIDLFPVAGSTSTRFPLQNLDFPSSMLRGHLLFVEANRLRAYDLTTGSGPVTLFSPGLGEFCCSVAATDAANVYLTVDGDNRGRLLKVTDSLTVQVLATESGSRILAASATPSRLVYSIVDASGVLYRSVPKSGGTPITIAPAEPCPDLSSVVVAGENIWYDCSALGFWDYGGFLHPPRGLPEQPFVGVVRSDGMPVQLFENAWIAGTASANPVPLVPDASTVHAVTVAHPGALRAYEGATGMQLIEYAAALPANLSLEGQTGSTWRLPSLFTALYAEGGHIRQRELFFFQTGSAGVTRVTSFAP